MLTFNDDKKSCDFSNVEVGDKFVMVSYPQYSSKIKSIISYEVKKIGKRDVFCESASGEEFKFSEKNIFGIHLFNQNSETLNDLKVRFRRQIRLGECQVDLNNMIKNVAMLSDETIREINKIAEQEIYAIKKL